MGTETTRQTPVLVSILTPSYQQAEWIGDTLKSVACQTYPAIEHIVADGGSTDGTVEALRAAGDAITWFSEPDRGQTDALNKAFRRSHGEIIGWMNSDDAYYDADVVARVVERFRARPDVDVIYGHGARIAEDGRVISILWTPRFSYRLMRRMNFIVQPTLFIRRSALPDCIVDEAFDFTMDWELWLRLGKAHCFDRMNSVTAVDREQPRRKNITAQAVFEENTVRLRAKYGLPAPMPAALWSVYMRFYSIRQRLMGALQVKAAANTPLAFDGYVDSEKELFSRQALLKQSKWVFRDRDDLGPRT